MLSLSAAREAAAEEWERRHSLSACLAARARADAVAKAREAAKLESRAYAEQQRIHEAAAEYKRLRKAIDLYEKAHVARHGRRPRGLSEMSRSLHALGGAE